MIKRPDNRGLTLVELMISVATFAMLILGLGYAVLIGQRASKQAKRQANVLLGCQQVLEELQQKTIEQIIAEDCSTFKIRTAGPDAPLREGGLVRVDKDLNGDGIIQTGSLYREGREENDLVRVIISFKDENNNDRIIIERVIAQRDN